MGVHEREPSKQLPSVEDYEAVYVDATEIYDDLNDKVWNRVDDLVTLSVLTIDGVDYKGWAIRSANPEGEGYDEYAVLASEFENGEILVVGHAFPEPDKNAAHHIRRPGNVFRSNRSSGPELIDAFCLVPGVPSISRHVQIKNGLSDSEVDTPRLSDESMEIYEDVAMRYATEEYCEKVDAILSAISRCLET